ncbi:MAG: DNA cytosine methyltransferase [Subdoligranulum sp.]
MLIRIFIRSNIISGAIFKILFRSFYAEILALQGFPAGLRDSYFIRDKAGYPEFRDNQTFSIAGSRKGFGDPRGTLFFELARLAEARKPPYLLFENVPYVQKCIRYIMYTNQICIAPPKNSGARLFLLCSTVHNMFLLAKG